MKSLPLITILLSLTNAQSNLIRYEDSRVSMACTYSIVAYGDDVQTIKQAVNEAFDEVDRIDRLMSHYKPNSPLSQLNREAAKRPVKTDPELFHFIAECLLYSQASNGAFDITVGPLMKAWGFFRGEGRMPSELEVQAVRKKIGWQHLRLSAEAQTIQFDCEGVELDLGGIAKGYAVDQAIKILKRHNLTRALISAGGSTIYALGSPPGSDAWDIELQDPLDARKIAMTVRLQDQSLSVSGRAEKFFELNGKRYSHIMNPRTGRPVMNVLSVAVIAPTGTMGDALDNAFYVQGVKRTKALRAQYPNTQVIFFLPDGLLRWKSVHLK
ncbi:MAG TPA: FAD:protein FMN transferase [Blastocatellia bacterium]|nr:FAD:protein FMN transferase [Blastocatellia bacterium]